jgi:hypothetical protein
MSFRVCCQLTGNLICDGHHQKGRPAASMRALSCVYTLITPERVTALVNKTSRTLRQCCGSIVPFRPGGAERSGFLQASTLDVMEVDHDLRKFITETPVAQRRGMLSSGREASGSVRSLRATVQRRTVSVAGGGHRGVRKWNSKSTMWGDSLQGRGSGALRRWAATYGPLRRCRRQRPKSVSDND